jgi:hypothetical protein
MRTRPSSPTLPKSPSVALRHRASQAAVVSAPSSSSSSEEGGRWGLVVHHRTALMSLMPWAFSTKARMLKSNCVPSLLVFRHVSR